jgi:hypothetical protein
MTSTIGLTVGLDRIAALHALELPQKDDLCGCFWAAIVLRASGIDDVDQDRVAEVAGTVLPDDDPARHVPPGESPRRDYRLRLPTATDPAEVGTSARALARAIESIAEGRLAVVPVAGPWRAESVAELVAVAAEAAPDATLVANIRTGPLWGSRPAPAALLAQLAGLHAEGPPADWDVGHFVNVAALVRGRGGSLLLVRDSYSSFGWQGYHFQPADAFARALERGDGHEGGVLCIAPAPGEADLRERLSGAGYELRHWDNGTPERSR